MICTKCKQDLPLDSFGKRKERPSGRRSACKPCLKVHRKNRERTKEGVITSVYHRELRAEERNISPPDYTLTEFMEWSLAQGKFHSLYDLWVAAGYTREAKPSADRKDDYVGYTLGNMQWLTFRENHLKGSGDVLKGVNRKALVAVLQFTKDGEFVQEYYSVAEANRQLGKPRHSSCIVAAIKGRQNTAHGYVWRYK